METFLGSYVLACLALTMIMPLIVWAFVVQQNKKSDARLFSLVTETIREAEKNNKKLDN